MGKTRHGLFALGSDLWGATLDQTAANKNPKQVAPPPPHANKLQRRAIAGLEGAGQQPLHGHHSEASP